MVSTKVKKHKSWFIDKDSQYRWIYHRVKKQLLSTKTQFQHVEIIDTYSFGRVVILDEKIQSAEADEFIYHEALVHPVMITHARPENILILGGGEGATLREVLKHSTVHRVTMIDIDKEFVSLCRKYLRKWHKESFKDPRVELIYDNALEYLKKINAQFDVIISDLIDPVEEGHSLSIYKKEFFSMLRKALMPDGIFVTHATALPYIPYANISVRIFRTITEYFPKVALYYEYIPSFGTLWSFITGSSKESPKTISSQIIQKRLKERSIEKLSYYDPETHEKLFRLPACTRKLFTTR